MATVNGLDVIIYSFQQYDNGVIMCDCYIPEAGWRIPVAANLIQVIDNRASLTDK